jgi:hypothetical protein
LAAQLEGTVAIVAKFEELDLVVFEIPTER